MTTTAREVHALATVADAEQHVRRERITAGVLARIRQIEAACGTRQSPTPLQAARDAALIRHWRRVACAK